MAEVATGVKNDRFSALIGLSPKSSETNLPAFLSQIRTDDQKKELSPLFSIYLSKNDGDDGVITFGGYDVSQYAKEGLTNESIFWSKASPFEKYWSIGLDQVALVTRGEDKVMPQSEELPYGARQLILDTGVSYTLVPKRDFEYILLLLGQFGVQCKKQEGTEGSLVDY